MLEDSDSRLYIKFIVLSHIAIPQILMYEVKKHTVECKHSQCKTLQWLIIIIRYP